MEGQTIQAEKAEMPQSWAVGQIQRWTTVVNEISELSQSAHGWHIETRQLGRGRFEAKNKSIAIGQIQLFPSGNNKQAFSVGL